MRITNVIICSKNYLNVLCVIFFSIAPDCNLLDIMELNFKKLTRKTSDKMLCNKGFNFAENTKYERYQRWLAPIFYKYFDKKIICYCQRPHNRNNKNENTSDQQLAQLHKTIIKKFKKRKVQSTFIGNILGADLADMKLISKFNERKLLFSIVIDISRTYGSVVLLNDFTNY